MSFFIQKLIKQKKIMPDPAGKFFMSLSDYEEHAKRLIGKYADKVRPGSRSVMLASSDAVGLVMNAIMIADWEHTEDCGFLLSTRRVKRAKWIMGRYLSFQDKELRSGKRSLNRKQEDYADAGETLSPVMFELQCAVPPDRSVEDLDEIEHLLKCAALTPKQRQFAELYYLRGMNWRDVMIEMDINKARVFQYASAVMGKLRMLVPQDAAA